MVRVAQTHSEKAGKTPALAAVPMELLLPKVVQKECSHRSVKMIWRLAGGTVSMVKQTSDQIAMTDVCCLLVGEAIEV